MLLSALFGVLLALVYKFGKKQATFPFAPAIVLASFVVLLADSLGVLKTKKPASMRQVSNSTGARGGIRISLLSVISKLLRT